MNFITTVKHATFALAGTIILSFSSCGSKQEQGGMSGPQNFPVFVIANRTTTLNTEYPATLQGEQNIEIRPKVDGFVEEIFIDEGSAVKKGQMLFKISAPQYEQEVNTAMAAIASAEAEVNTAQLQVTKTKSLADKSIISHFDLESAENTLLAKKAALTQAKATLSNARTNLGYTTISSPVDGVVGSIPYRIGSLVSSTNAQPLTTVSNIRNVFAYFSLNEKQLLNFSRTVKGSTMNEKLANTPPVILTLADGTDYAEPGKIQTIAGLINTQTGSVSLRASFPNPLGLIRSGGSAIIKIPQEVKDAIVIPQKSTYELQGKRFVYVLEKNNMVKSREIEIMDVSAGQFYVVTKGLKAGDKLIYEGTNSLQDSTQVNPEIIPDDKVYLELSK